MKKRAIVKTKKTTVPLYVYVSASTKARVMRIGRARFGTASKYISHLIANDRTEKARAA